MNKTFNSVSERNTKELKDWFDGSGYKSIHFYVPPNIIISKEACESEVLNALKVFETDKEKKPTNLIL